ncbi:hypothetical protein FNV43_RR18174 [Rhamnella rubrinervis]|uniref:Uncharacterized protein n=1 Tax=Rhamnella rubrinervis TaxID=2594499 RepID=A0A8K0E0A9_9ROSA|nr:hypothetical protein FNV43_RR18174 [Rhamnella rubrinervis]
MAKTGEAGKEKEHEEVEKQVQEDGECSTSVQLDDSSFLSEMNLVIVFCSLCSLSTQENPSFRGSDKEIVQGHEAKACVPRLHTSRRQNHETKLVGRRTHKFHTSVKDSRHGRRM